MKTLLHLFGRSETPVLLFGIGVFLFVWPYLSVSATNNLAQLYSLLFTSWLILITGTALVSIAARRQDQQDRE